MAGVIDTVTSSGNLSTYGAQSSSSPTETTASSETTTTAEPLRNPQIIQDPSAGFITQYVDSNSGQIMAQTPSAAVVAYLRQGLTATGMPPNATSPGAVATTA